MQVLMRTDFIVITVKLLSNMRTMAPWRVCYKVYGAVLDLLSNTEKNWGEREIAERHFLIQGVKRTTTNL